MPLRHRDAFIDPTDIPDRGINPYLARVKNYALDGEIKPLFGASLEKVAGQWRSIFGTPTPPDTPLFLEIGCYKGNNLAEAAAENPNFRFIGIDITFKRIALTTERLVANKCTNAAPAMLRVSALTLKQVFAPAELDGVMIFFPDPWTKKSQRKNRLINSEFCQSLHQCLRHDGRLWFKTDQKDYFDEASASLAEAGFSLSEEKSLFAEEDNLITPFQARFSAQSLPSYAGVWRKL